MRSWLTYLTLVAAAIVVLGDAIAFLDAFLSGDLSVRFALKSIVLVALAGGVFAYYLATVRGPAAAPRRDRSFAAAAVAAAVAALACGFWNVGTPAQARAGAMDEGRVTDLAAISAALHNLYKPGASLPATLAKLPTPSFVTHDPATRAPYAYRVLGGSRYQLCAVFDTVDAAARPPFRHGRGRQCFTLDASQP